MRGVAAIRAFPWAGVFAVMFAFLAQNGIRDLGSGATAVVPLPPKYAGLAIDARIVRNFLGIRLIVADFLWIDALFKSDITREPQPFTEFYKTVKTIVDLDPDNYFAYYMGGMYLSVIKDDIKGATELLRLGAQHLEKADLERPIAWKVYYTLGYHLLFEEHLFEEGSKWMHKASTISGAPLYVRALGQRVATSKGQLEVASRVLNDLYSRVSSPEEKKRVEEKMLKIALQQELLDLNERFDSYLDSTGARSMPRARAFDLFIRSIGHPRKDLLGRPLQIDSNGRIAPRS